MSGFHDLMNSGVVLLECVAGDDFDFEGARLRGNFRTGNPMEQAEAGAFVSHGGQSRSVVILEVGRAQFSAPLVRSNCRSKKLKRYTPTPAEYTVADVNADDPNVYAFVLIGRG